MVKSFKVLTTLTAYRVVAAVSGTANTVQYPESAAKLALGVTIDDVKETTGSIAVKGPGEIAELYFNDTCTSGQEVAFDTSGRGIALSLDNTTTASSTPTGVIGVLVGETVSATGTIADVYLLPHLLNN